MKLLLLAGTGDARRIAQELVAMKGVKTIASLSGATRNPKPLAVETRHGGFAEIGGLADYLITHRFDALLDATHPFAARMSFQAAQTARELALPHVQMLRPEWEASAADRWTMIASEADAANHIPSGARVFVATGRKTLEAYDTLTDHEVICRRIDPPKGPFPLRRGRYIVNRPPFSVADEVRLFRDLGIDWLVVKNSGGAASRTKLDAARDLGLPVLMIRRPAQPDCNRVATVAEALAWVWALR